MNSKNSGAYFNFVINSHFSVNIEYFMKNIENLKSNMNYIKDIIK